jgi:hypothetical protein
MGAWVIHATAQAIIVHVMLGRQRGRSPARVAGSAGRGMRRRPEVGHLAEGADHHDRAQASTHQVRGQVAVVPRLRRADDDERGVGGLACELTGEVARHDTDRDLHLDPRSEHPVADPARHALPGEIELSLNVAVGRDRLRQAGFDDMDGMEPGASTVGLGGSPSDGSATRGRSVDSDQDRLVG